MKPQPSRTPHDLKKAKLSLACPGTIMEAFTMERSSLPTNPPKRGRKPTPEPVLGFDDLDLHPGERQSPCRR